MIYDFTIVTTLTSLVIQTPNFEFDVELSPGFHAPDIPLNSESFAPNLNLEIPKPCTLNPMPETLTPDP